MKWNWAYGLVTAIIGFIVFIMSMVIRMSTNSKFNHDLVTEDYYAKEIMYQEDIDAEKNSNNEIGIESHRSENGWVISFPASWDFHDIEGEASFYRPSNKKLDFSVPLKLSSNQIEIIHPKLIEGRWNIRVSFDYQEKSYLKKQSIFFD